jgi:NAD-dependent deacetylase
MTERKKKIVVLTGAGISAESGIPTFRDANGLWEGHDVMAVASPDGWFKNKKLVLDFYNERRRNLRNVQPNKAHYDLAELEKDFNVVIVTQNVDDLHERAGSANVIHLHGELLKAQSTRYPEEVYHLGDRDIQLGDKCEFGSQLRPNVVWFGEPVPLMDKAMREVSDADFFLVVGTSMQVYPAASLINYAPVEIPKYLIDPNIPENIGDMGIANLHTYEMKATEGVEKAIKDLKSA